MRVVEYCVPCFVTGKYILDPSFHCLDTDDAGVITWLASHRVMSSLVG